MSNTIIKSPSVFLIAGKTPSWKTGQEEGYLFPMVQDSQLSLDFERQSSKQIGSTEYAVNDIFRAPTVKFNTTYYASPYGVNEYLMGMNAGFSSHQPVFSGISNRDQSFYLILDKRQGKDALEEFKKTSNRNLTGVSAISIGNCFLSNYSISFNVGSIPTASASFTASNVQFENVTGNSIEIPAINLQSGNASGAGTLNLNTLKVSVTGDPTIDEFVSGYSVPVASPQQTQAYLKNLQVGGIPLQDEDTLIQSFNLSLNLERQDLYGLGSNHVYGRKLLFPIVGSVEISVIVSGIRNGKTSGVLVSESGYDLEIEFKDSKLTAYNSLYIENAKLDSYSFGVPINDSVTFNAVYSFQATESGGLLSKIGETPDEGFVFAYLSDRSQIFLEREEDELEEALQVPK
jgi:hypothetical protein